MNSSILLKKLYLEKIEFITSEELKKYCKEFEMDYTDTVRYFIRRGYLIRIFKKIFYLRSIEEIKLGRTKYSYRDLIAKGLELKDIKNWYFGLYSALKMNNMTHESFIIDHILNDKLFRPNPINIMDYKIEFHKISPKLLTFGIIKKRNINYSDPEKTILDFMYIWKYNGVSEKIIIMDLADYAKNVSKEKLTDYSNYYPNSVKKALEGLK
jgi:predicted transcriptional regulator of viral defense system